MPTHQGRSTGGCLGKSLLQGTADPAGGHVQDIPRRGGGSAGDKTWCPDGRAHRHGVPACRQGRGKRIKEMTVACSERGARWCSGDVTVQMGRTGCLPARRMD